MSFFSKTTMFFLMLSSSISFSACAPSEQSCTPNINDLNDPIYDFQNPETLRNIYSMIQKENPFPEVAVLKKLQEIANSLPPSTTPVLIDGIFIFGYYPTGDSRFNLYTPATKRIFLNRELAFFGANFTVPEAADGQEGFFNPKSHLYREGQALADVTPIWKAYNFLQPFKKAHFDMYSAEKALHDKQIQDLIREKEKEIEKLKAAQQSPLSFGVEYLHHSSVLPVSAPQPVFAPQPISAPQLAFHASQRQSLSTNPSNTPCKRPSYKPMPSLSPMGASPFPHMNFNPVIGRIPKDKQETQPVLPFNALN